MTATEIKAEITRLTEIVRYSQKKESDEAAREVCKLQAKLKEAKK